MKKLITAAVATAAVVAPIALTAAPAEAAWNIGCVTKGEMKRVHKGMSMTRVHQIMGTTGKVTSRANFGGYASQSREYRSCTSPTWSYIGIVWEKSPGTAYTVYGKTQFFA